MAATRALAARTERLDPAAVTTAFLKEDRHGRVYVDPTRAGGASLAAAYSPRPGPACRCRSRSRGPTSTGCGRRTSPSGRRRSSSGTPTRGAASLPAPQELPDDLLAEGHAIPVPRVVAMHEGKRRARARRETSP